MGRFLALGRPDLQLGLARVHACHVGLPYVRDEFETLAAVALNQHLDGKAVPGFLPFPMGNVQSSQHTRTFTAQAQVHCGHSADGWDSWLCI